MRVFVAGGTGVVGRATLRAMVEAGHQVRSTARGKEKADLVRRVGAEPIEVDLYNPKGVREAVAGSDAVVRLTTKIGPMMKLGKPRTWDETIRLRTTGARILLDAALAEGAQVYVHESVVFVYSDGEAAWLAEDAPVDDGGVAILRATLEGEQEAARFSELGRRGVVLRFGGFYGPDAPSTLETVAMARRRMLFQFGPASNYFSSIYVADAARAVLAAINIPAGTYNVCDDEPVTFVEYLRTLAASIGAAKPPRLPASLASWMLGDVGKYFSRSLRVSNARLKTASDWRPSVRSVFEGWPLIAADLAAHGAAMKGHQPAPPLST